MKRKPQTIPHAASSHKRHTLTAKKLLEMPLEGVMGKSPGMQEQYLDLFLGSDSYIVGDLQHMNNKQIATVHQLKVCKMLRGHGLGERLFKSFVAEAKVRGATELWSDNVSNMALGLRIKVFGQKALTFYDSDHPELGFLPITPAQAMAVSNRVIENWQQGKEELPAGDLGVHVNLESIDTNDWPRPSALYEQDMGLLAQ